MPTLDLAAFGAGKISYADLTGELNFSDLRALTDELYTTIHAIISSSTDADVSFVPHDLAAKDTNEQGWTLSHVIAHLTATAEESAVTAALLAKGVTPEGRLRYETPWETLQTAQQVLSRLQESQRMCNAYLDAWPDAPQLDVTLVRVPHFGPLNAIRMYVLGYLHGTSHIEQVREIMRQAGQSRS
jgi:hypothetical protein